MYVFVFLLTLVIFFFQLFNIFDNLLIAHNSGQKIFVPPGLWQIALQFLPALDALKLLNMTIFGRIIYIWGRTKVLPDNQIMQFSRRTADIRTDNQLIRPNNSFSFLYKKMFAQLYFIYPILSFNITLKHLRQLNGALKFACHNPVCAKIFWLLLYKDLSYNGIITLEHCPI